MLSMSIYTDEMLVDPLINTMLGLVINSKVTYGKAGQAGTHKLSKVSTHRNHKLSMKMVPLRPHNQVIWLPALAQVSVYLAQLH